MPNMKDLELCNERRELSKLEGVNSFGMKAEVREDGSFGMKAEVREDGLCYFEDGRIIDPSQIIDDVEL